MRTSTRGESRLPETHSLYTVLLHIEVYGFVVGSEESRCLALVPPGGLEDPTDRLLLGVCRGRLADRLQRAVQRSIFPECRCRGRTDAEERKVLRLDHIRSEEDSP